MEPRQHHLTEGVGWTAFIVYCLVCFIRIELGRADKVLKLAEEDRIRVYALINTEPLKQFKFTIKDKNGRTIVYSTGTIDYFSEFRRIIMTGQWS